MGTLKIEFGCGEKPTKKDFKTCDVRNLPGIDYVCEAWNIDRLVAPDSVEEIFSRHFFEHLTYIQGDEFLKRCITILKSGGVFECEVPDIDFHCRQWLEGSDMRHAIAGFWGWQRGQFTDIWDIHKSGYNFELLKTKLEKHGFVRVEHLSSEPHNLRVRAFKS